ncbi:MAG TPA: hypothetical protein VFM53_15305 [Anaeromyxobacteraceae bacterium]|nr:hypothetical protein [Anaeromyxobacteraceae bacterium]
MRRPRPPPPSRWEGVRRELQRARGARRMIPWALLSAALGFAAMAWAGRSWRAGLPLLVGGLLFALVIRQLAIPHCPDCGKGLWLRGERPGPPTAPVPTQVERDRKCPRCGAGLDG